MLPANAGKVLKAIDQVSGPSADITQALTELPGFKYQSSDVMLPYLVWEYGLENLLPYLSDARLALQEGVRWQRIIGTPQAVNLAMGWLGYQHSQIESEVPGAHFFEYQIDLGELLASSQLTSIQAVNQFSAPLRSRLSRLYHGFDVRRLVLDESDYGAMLSDNSGITYQGTKLSFGQAHPHALTIAPDNPDKSLTKYRSAQVKDDFWPQLDGQKLGGPATGASRESDLAFSYQLKYSTWSGRWDSRTWREPDYLSTGTKHQSV